MSTPVPDPSQPTVYEMIRTLSRQMDEQRQATTRLETVAMSLVTQEQRIADRELTRLQLAELGKDVAEISERSTWARRAAFTAIASPVMVAAVLWALNASVQMPPA